jgi:hypothetical protein
LNRVQNSGFGIHSTFAIQHSVPIREGMRFVQEAVLKNSESSSCRKDGKRVTMSPVGVLNQQEGLREMLVNCDGVTLRICE